MFKTLVLLRSFMVQAKYLLLVGGVVFLISAKNKAKKFEKTLEFGQFQFQISTSDSGAIREMTLVVYQRDKFLLKIKQKTDGNIVDADVADLDRNGSPELYIFTQTYGSGSFGKIIGFQFYPSVFNSIATEPLSPIHKKGYMGHDIYKINGGYLLRTFPVYDPANANAFPTGGFRTVVYRLVNSNNKLLLKAIQ